ncbi:MAG TPA: hypothetical protein VFZ35_00485 [Sphingomicrobium sp.]
MSDPARITIAMKEGELNVYVNEAGRDLLVKELTHLSRSSDHTHFGTWEGAEVELCDIPYAPGDDIVHAAKISLRPDDWDKTYFPHVLAKGS